MHELMFGYILELHPTDTNGILPPSQPQQKMLAAMTKCHLGDKISPKVESVMNYLLNANHNQR